MIRNQTIGDVDVCLFEGCKASRIIRHLNQYNSHKGHLDTHIFTVEAFQNKIKNELENLNNLRPDFEQEIQAHFAQLIISLERAFFIIQARLINCYRSDVQRMGNIPYLIQMFQHINEVHELEQFEDKFRIFNNLKPYDEICGKINDKYRKQLKQFELVTLQEVLSLNQSTILRRSSKQLKSWSSVNDWQWDVGRKDDMIMINEGIAKMKQHIKGNFVYNTLLLEPTFSIHDRVELNLEVAWDSTLYAYGFPYTESYLDQYGNGYHAGIQLTDILIRGELNQAVSHEYFSEGKGTYSLETHNYHTHTSQPAIKKYPKPMFEPNNLLRIIYDGPNEIFYIENRTKGHSVYLRAHFKVGAQLRFGVTVFWGWTFRILQN